MAKAHHAPFIDLTLIVTQAYKKIGPETVETFFADKGTHTTLAGAEVNARSVVAGLKNLAPDPLAAYFSDKAADVAAYVPDAAAQ